MPGGSGDTDIEKRLMDTVGKGEGGRNGKSSVETYMTICKIDSQQEFAVWLLTLKQGLYINLKGGMGRKMGGRFKGVGIYVYLWLIHVEV